MSLLTAADVVFYALCGMVAAAIVILTVLGARADRDRDEVGDDTFLMLHDWDAALERLVREEERHG